MFINRVNAYLFISTIVCFTVLKVTGKLKCYECSTKFLEHERKVNKNCPTDGETTNIAYAECSGKCIYRTNSQYPGIYFRSCSTLHNLPKGLPDSGCYSYSNEIFCFCNSDQCNRKSIGDMFENKTFEEIPFNNNITGKPTDKSEDDPKQCYSCLNIANEKENPNCPSHGKLKSLQTIYRTNCTGVCLVRTVVQQEGVVARGCSDDIYHFPKKLPKDGCYSYFMDTVCFCRGHLCNVEGLKKPQKMELDFLETLEKNFSACILSDTLLMSTFLVIGIMLNYL